MEPVWLKRNIKHYNDDDIRWEDANNDNGQITERGTEAAAATTGVQWFAEQAIILPSLQSSFFLSETLPPHHFPNFGWKKLFSSPWYELHQVDGPLPQHHVRPALLPVHLWRPEQGLIINSLPKRMSKMCDILFCSQVVIFWGRVVEPERLFN